MKPETALVTTKAHLPTIWPAFERAMKQNRTVMFKNNYQLLNDESLPAKMDRMVALSGMNRSFAQLVSRNAQALFSSGIWDFWRVLEMRRVGKSEKVGRSRRFEDEFRPLAMDHEGMYTPFVVLGTLLGVSGLLYAVSFLSQLKNMLVRWVSCRKSLSRKEAD